MQENGVVFSVGQSKIHQDFSHDSLDLKMSRMLRNGQTNLRRKAEAQLRCELISTAVANTYDVSYT